MQTNLSFSKKTTRICFLATVTLLLLLSARSTAFAGIAIWDMSPGSGDWNTNTNWTPNTGYPNGPLDVATFDFSFTPAISISVTTLVSGITFNASANAFTITVYSGVGLQFSGAGIAPGITNNSGPIQNFVIAGAAVSGGAGGTMNFLGASTAGNGTAFTNNGGAVGGAGGGLTQFFDSSNAGSGTFTNNGGTVSGASAGATMFFNNSNAGSSTITNNAGVTGANGGVTIFSDNSNAGTATLIANGGTGGGRFDSF
jgi:hypothetical protein